MGNDSKGAGHLMRYVVCLPFRVQEFRDECLATCKLENIVEIDNTENNIGIMASHNIGIEELYKQDADWFIIMSAAIRFGERGGLDLIEYLEQTDAQVVEEYDLYGWHLMAFRRDVIDAVGQWDENFTPYGYDDLDYSIRLQKAFPNIKWEKTTFDVSDTIMGHSIKLGGVRSNDNILHQYFYNKWGHYPGGGHPVNEYYDTPFNLPDVDIKYFPKENDVNHVSKITKGRYS
jgi:GT2 family glycosyltransferase